MQQTTADVNLADRHIILIYKFKLFPITGIYANPKVLQHVLSNYKRILPELLGYSYLPKLNTSTLTDILLEKYTENKPLNNSFEGLAKVKGRY